MVKRKTRQKLHIVNFETYISKLLKQVHPKMSITADVKSQINSLLNVIGNALSQKAVELATINNKKTISSRDIQSAVRIILPGEISKHAVSNGTKAVIKYGNAKANHKKGDKKQTVASKTGLLFPPIRARKLLESHTRYKITAGAPIYLVAVLEYLCSEMIELSGNNARDNKKKTINSRHISTAIMNDEELSRLINEVSWEVLGGGVLPNIHDKLLPPKKEK